MAKKNNKNATKSKNATYNGTKNLLPDSLSADEMKKIIVDAMMEFEMRKAEAKKEEVDLEQVEWDEILGIKRYSSDVRFYKWKTWCSQVTATIKLLFFSSDEIKGSRITKVLMRSMTSSMMRLISNVIMVTVIALLIINVKQGLLDVTELWYIIPVSIVVLLSSFIIAKFINLASYEIDEMEDNNFVFGVFASITSMISIAIAVVSSLS